MISITGIKDTVILARQKYNILFSRQKPPRIYAFGKLRSLLEQAGEVNEGKLSAVLKIKCASKAVRSSKGQVLWQKSRIKSWELSSLMVSYISFLIQSMVMDWVSVVTGTVDIRIMM